MYKKYSDKDLIDSYKAMMDYSGKISVELEAEINQRMGMEKFQQIVANQTLQNKELKRINVETCSLTTKQTDYEFVRKMIKSEIFNETELDLIVKRAYEVQQFANNDREIGSKTVIGSLVGMLVGGVIGGILFYLSIVALKQIVLYVLIPIYILNYLVIKLFVKKTRGNVVVFIGSFLGTIISLVVGIWLNGQ